MPSPRRIASVLSRRHVPLNTRAGLLATEARRRLRRAPAYRVTLGPGHVFLSHDDYNVDWESLKFVVADRAYETDYTDAIVLDLGAHKGYYGAYALSHGARTVISFEPEKVNGELLEKAATVYREGGADWRVRHVAVGPERGEAELHVMGASWGHALHPPETWAQDEVGVERVAVEAMSDVLAEAAALATGDAPLIMKVNIEGEECSVVLGTPVEHWERVDELFIEVHPWAACTAPQLAAHVAPAGFSETASLMEPVLRLRRGAAPRSGRRSAPR